MYRLFYRAGLAIGLIIFSFSAQSVGLSPPYTGNYNASSAQSGSNLHSIWLSGIPGSDYFQFVGPADFRWPGSVAGDQATLDGTILQNGTANSRFVVSFTWSFKGVGGAFGGPKCEGDACVDNDPNLWAYFDLVSATMSGVGDLLGLELVLSQAPASLAYPFQIGYGANGKAPTDDFGGSMWFNWLVTQNTSGFAINSTGHGDVNIVLTPVPIPAALPLFATALLGAGLLSRRRRPAAD